MENRKTVILIMRTLCAISFIWLAITTGYTVYQASQGWGNKWLIVAAVVTMFVLVDSYGQSLGKFTIRAIIDHNFRNDIGGLTFVIVFMLFAGRFTASTFMTYIASKPLAESITPPPDTNKDQVAIEKAQAARSGNIEALKAEKERLERSEARRIREAQKAGKKIVNDAIDAGGSGFAKLYRDNNPWVKNEPKFRKTREAIKAAKVQADGLVYIEKEATREAQRAYMAALGGKDEVATALASVMKSKADRYESKVSRYTIALYLVDFAAAILAIITLIAIVKYEVKTNTQYKGVFNDVMSRVGGRVKEDVLQATEKTALSGWELVFTGASKIPTLLRWLNVVFWVKFVGTIERLLKVDLDGNGDIGNDNDQKQATNFVNVAANDRPIVAGFSLNKTGAKIGDTSGDKQVQNVAMSPNVAASDNVAKMSQMSPTAFTQNLSTNNRRQNTMPATKKRLATKGKSGDKGRTPIAADKDKCRTAYRRFRNGSGTEDTMNKNFQDFANKWNYKVEINQGRVEFIPNKKK